LSRPSAVGPRLEKSITSRASLAPESGTPQPSLPPIDRTFSDAPTAMTFFALPGDPTVPATGPALPAAKTSTICWLPPTPGCASRTIESYSCESAS
jgi:hypothetical protein